MSGILVLHPSVVTAKLRRDLSRAGIILVESEDPQSVRFLPPESALSGSQLLLAALRGLQSTASSAPRDTFAKEVLTMFERDMEPKRGRGRRLRSLE